MCEERTTLPSLKKRLEGMGQHTYVLEESLRRHFGGKMPRGYKTFLYDARNGRELPLYAAQVIADVLGVTLEKLQAERPEWESVAPTRPNL